MPFHSMLEFWLCWPCIGLLQPMTAAVNSRVRSSSSVQKTFALCSSWPLALTDFLHLLLHCFLSLGERVWCEWPICGLVSEFWLVVISVLTTVHCTKKFLGWCLNGELKCMSRDTNLDNSLTLCPFSRENDSRFTPGSWDLRNNEFWSRFSVLGIYLLLWMRPKSNQKAAATSIAFSTNRTLLPHWELLQVTGVTSWWDYWWPSPLATRIAPHTMLAHKKRLSCQYKVDLFTSCDY